MDSLITSETPPKSIRIMLAGAPFEIIKGEIIGSFWAIPISLWHAIIGFQREIALRHEAEAMTYIRWNQKVQAYHSFIPHQTTVRRGLSVTCNLQSAENIAILDNYGRSWGEDFMSGVCTIHSHVDVSAFESGTDANDEQSLPGFHITLGHLLSKKEYHLDFRIRVPHTPKIRAIIDPDSCFKIGWESLFVAGTKKEDVFQCPGSATWVKYASRVTAR